MAAEHVDVVVLAAGPWGRWQAKQAVLLALLKLPIAWFQLAILFLAPPHPFWCEDPAPQPEVSQTDTYPKHFLKKRRRKKNVRFLLSSSSFSNLCGSFEKSC